jgi:hypothetical protein
MFGLGLAHLTAAEQERDLEADLRQRRILKESEVGRRPIAAPTPDTVTLSASRRLPATGRVRAAGR